MKLKGLALTILAATGTASDRHARPLWRHCQWFGTVQRCPTQGHERTAPRSGRDIADHRHVQTNGACSVVEHQVAVPSHPDQGESTSSRISVDTDHSGSC